MGSPLLGRRRFYGLAGAAALLASGSALASCARGASAHPPGRGWRNR